MKKNKFLKIASGLLMLVLITCCAVSGTFAKYVTEGEATDTARVAEWGVIVTVTGNDAFGEKYNDKIDASGTKVVSNTSGENVVAPGTNGTLGSYTITGTPEVRVEVEVALAITLTGWEIMVDTDADGVDDASKFYCPLVISDGTNKVDGKSFIGNKDGFIAAIEALVDKAATEVAANADLSTSYPAVELTWAWAFETGDNASEKAANSEKDTKLGNLAAEGNASTIKVDWKVTVEQVD